MSKIEQIKSYEGQNLDTIFFRPMLTGDSANDLGIKVMYNTPVPTTLHFWKRNGDILRKYTSSGWSGGEPATKLQKTIHLSKVKAEMAYSAEDYFSTVFELIAARADVNFEDLSGTELEEAETKLFRASIAESIRSTMWYGNSLRSSGVLGTFDGFMKRFMECDGTEDPTLGENAMTRLAYIPNHKEGWAEALLKQLWDNSTEQLKALRSEGQLAFFVSTDVYNAYEEELDNVAIEAAYLAKQSGREALYYRGIPVIDLRLGSYAPDVKEDMPSSFAFLTDRRNLALAVNTNDFPGTEVRMWYNPDLMENRQRAIFMAGCDFLFPELVSVAMGLHLDNLAVEAQGENFVLTANLGEGADGKYWAKNLYVTLYDHKGEKCAEKEAAEVTSGDVEYDFEGADIAGYEIVAKSGFGGEFVLKGSL